MVAIENTRDRERNEVASEEKSRNQAETIKQKEWRTTTVQRYKKAEEEPLSRNRNRNVGQ
jgi:hypothetical protein